VKISSGYTTGGFSSGVQLHRANFSYILRLITVHLIKPRATHPPCFPMYVKRLGLGTVKYVRKSRFFSRVNFIVSSQEKKNGRQI
jgi:hypothetical protein